MCGVGIASFHWILLLLTPIPSPPARCPSSPSCPIFPTCQVAVACSVSEEAHSCHPHAAHLSEQTGGRISFSDISQQLNVSSRMPLSKLCREVDNR